MKRLVAALAAAALVAPASAGAGWTAPQPITSMSLPNAPGGPEFADDGSGLAVFAMHSQEAHTSGTFTGARFLTRPPTGVWTARTSSYLKARLEPLAQTVAGDGAVVVLGRLLEAPASVNQRTTGLAVRYGALDRDGVTFDRRQTLTGGGRFYAPGMAGNHAGDAAAVWTVSRGARKGRGVFVARRKPGERFGAPVRLAARSALGGTLQVAVGPEGGAIVAWRHGRRIVVREASPGGAFGPRRELAAVRTSVVAVAAGRGGRAIVAWVRPSGGVGVARLGPHASFSVSTLDGEASSSLFAAFDAAGRALVVRDAATGPKVTTFGGGRRTETIGQAGDVQDLAVSRGGRAALTILSPRLPENRTLYVSVRGRDGRFGTPERASPVDQKIGAALLGFDPRAGQPSVLYFAFPDDFATADVYATARLSG